MNRSDLLSLCKDCTERHELCHAECESYKQYRANRKAMNEWQRDFNQINSIIATRRKRIAREMKRLYEEKRRKR